jgi:alanyl-tRNA synthetase
VTHAQLREIEELVNQRVIENLKVEAYEVDFDKKPEGTLAYFGEKYGKVVRVVDIGGFSRELCAGTHVASTGEIGFIHVIHEGAIAAGTRRIEAVSGEGAFRLAQRAFETVSIVATRLGTSADQVEPSLAEYMERRDQLGELVGVYQQKEASSRAREISKGAETRGDLKVVRSLSPSLNTDALRSMGAQILSEIGEGVVVLASSIEGKASVVAFCSAKAIAAGFNAGGIVKDFSQRIGGKGGGKADFAMGGGRDVSKLEEALAAALPKA